MPLIFALIYSNSTIGATFYISPAGNDNSAGTNTGPWASFSHALSKLNPGDTLVAKNGTYNQQIIPTVSGATNNPITVMAENPGNASIIATEGGSALKINSVHHINVDGFKFESTGESPTVSIDSPDGQPAEGDMATHHIELTRLGIKGSCYQNNCNTVTIARVNNVIFEDSWVYGAGRYTVSFYGARDSVINRVLIRWDAWIGDNYKPNDPRFGFGMYNSHNNKVLNVIVLDSASNPSGYGGDKGGMTLAGGDNGITAPFTNSSYNEFKGMLLINNIGNNLDMESRSLPHTDNTFEHSVIYGGDYGVVMMKKVTGTIFNHMTIYEPGEGGINTWSDEVINNKVFNSIITKSTGRAFNGSFEKDYNVIFDNDTNNYSGDNDTTSDPKLQFLLSNNTTALISLGSDPSTSSDSERGAEINNRYSRDGNLTSTSLWPWPNENRAKDDMCNSSDLTKFGRTGSNTSAWCESNKSLTKYLWEMLGSECPSSICTARSLPLPPKFNNIQAL